MRRAAGGGGAGRDKELVCGTEDEHQAHGYVLGALGGPGGTAIAALDVEALAGGIGGGEREGINWSGLGAPGNATGTGGTENPNGPIVT